MVHGFHRLGDFFLAKKVTKKASTPMVSNFLLSRRLPCAGTLKNGPAGATMPTAEKRPALKPRGIYPCMPVWYSQFLLCNRLGKKFKWMVGVKIGPNFSRQSIKETEMVINRVR